MSAEPPPPVRFLLNGELVRSDVPPWRGVLDHLRRDRRVVGVREGCREGDCGACTVLLGELVEAGRVRYRPVPACLLLVSQLEGRHLVTIEGLTPREGLSPLQRIVAEEGATQCGFCTPGILVAWTAWLLDAEATSERDAIAAISGNLCRCTGYASLRRSARRIREEVAGALERPPEERIDALVEAEVLPAFFRDAPSALARLAEEEAERHRQAASGRLGQIFSNAAENVDYWKSQMEGAKQVLVLLCKTCGAPQEKTRDFRCGYCGGELFRRREEEP